MINKQNRSKTYLSIIAILLVTNIAMVAFFLLKKDKGRHDKPRMERRAMISNFLKTEIGFDTIQLRLYDTLSIRHKESMKQMFDHLKNVRLLCRPDQLPKFDSLFVKVLNRRGSEGRKKQEEKK